MNDILFQHYQDDIEQRKAQHIHFTKLWTNEISGLTTFEDQHVNLPHIPQANQPTFGNSNNLGMLTLNPNNPSVTSSRRPEGKEKHNDNQSTFANTIGKTNTTAATNADHETTIDYSSTNESLTDQGIITRQTITTGTAGATVTADANVDINNNDDIDTTYQ